MTPKKQKALGVAGWKFGMTDDERQLLDARVEVALAVRRQRESRSLSQKQLASRIKTSQPRIVKIEQAATDVSFDQLLRAFAAAGGRIAVKRVPARRSKGPNRAVRSAATVIELQVAAD
jgi:ribosome-binding protein aMBF1 (putative translation factor)